MININYNFVDGAYLEIVSPDKIDDLFDVVFYNNLTGEEIYRWEIGINTWVKSYIKYFVEWRIEVTNKSTGKRVFEYTLDLQGKNVYVELSSTSLGDNIAWYPYIEKFTEKHKCNTYTYVQWSNLFEERSDIAFLSAYSENREKYFACYYVGWHLENDTNSREDFHPTEARNQQMQKCASDILGLDFIEIKPKLRNLPPRKKKKSIALAMQSTLQAKYWNRKGGWNELLTDLKSLGYSIKDIDQHKKFGGDGWWNEIPNLAEDLTGTLPMEDRIKTIMESKFLIGLGSGLSWVAWACGVPVVMISGFSKPYTEPSTGIIRIFNDEVCNGCFNDPTAKFDRDNWLWCPREEHFICTGSITPKMIMDAIRKEGLI